MTIGRRTSSSSGRSRVRASRSTRDGATLVFEKQKGADDKTPEKWVQSQPKKDVEETKILDALSAVTNLRAASFVDEVPGGAAQVAQFKAKAGEGKKDDLVTLLKAGEDYYATRAGDPGAAKLGAIRGRRRAEGAGCAEVGATRPRAPRRPLAGLAALPRLSVHNGAHDGGRARLALPSRTLVACVRSRWRPSPVARRRRRPSRPRRPDRRPPAAASAVAPTLEPSLASVDRGAMAAELDPLFAAPGLRTAVWSVLVQSLDTGEVLYRLNPDTLVMPASNQKIVSTAVAAARLGWDFRFETRLEAAGPVTDGVLQGDLFVTGNGDPTINARDGRRDAFFDEMAAALRGPPASRRSGDASIGDDNAFDDERFGFGVVVGRLRLRLTRPPSARSRWTRTSSSCRSRPGPSQGQPATVAAKQVGSDLTLVNRVTTGASDSESKIE